MHLRRRPALSNAEAPLMEHDCVAGQRNGVVHLLLRKVSQRSVPLTEVAPAVAGDDFTAEGVLLHGLVHTLASQALHYCVASCCLRWTAYVAVGSNISEGVLPHALCQPRSGAGAGLSGIAAERAGHRWPHRQPSAQCLHACS